MKTDPINSGLLFTAGRCRLIIVILALLVGFIPGIPGSAQQAQPEAQRKALQKSVPSYPAMAKTLRLSGMVKVAIKVAPNGKVVAAEVLGGHPLFTQPAVDAVRQWRFEAARQETDEIVYINFQP
jgi:TonB family protein